MSSSPAAAKAFPAQRYASKLWAACAALLIRRRILLSGLLFGSMIALDVLYGSKPHDVFNLRDPVSVTGVLLVVAGLALRCWAAGVLHKNAELTTTGPYSLIRNPLYLGSFMMMFGFCALIGDPYNFLLILGPVLLIYVIKVRHEEQLLASHFPQKWDQYARTTPRFVPRLRVGRLSAEWRFSQWMRHREYQALLATLAALVGIQVWRAM